MQAKNCVVTIVLLSCLVLAIEGGFPSAISCESCGRECASACGTRHFRTCCFNYLRKRSSPPALSLAVPPPPPPTFSKFDFWLSKVQAERDAARSALFNDRDNLIGTAFDPQRQRSNEDPTSAVVYDSP